jgi:uncharacterized membrane protein
MPPWLYIWIARVASGERFRKATLADWRFHSGFFLLFPIFIIVGVYFGHSFLDRAGAVLIWLVATLSLIIFLVVGYVWARFVPAVVSLAFGIIAWAAFAWLSWHYM